MEKSRILYKLEKNAIQHSDKVAVAFDKTKYSFSQLLEESRRLSSAIDSKIIKQPIIVFANRDAETVLFFLAVIISGNFYVPIDPDMPVEKLRTIVDEIQPIYCFGNEKNADLVGELGFKNRFLTINSHGEYRQEIEITEDFPLYMIYTSGSTGKPKGVLKNHSSMISFMETFVRTFGIIDDVIGNQTPFFFDASAKDIYLMIESCSTLEIIPSALFIMPPRLIAYLNEKKITFISWVPTALSHIAQMNAFKYVVPEFLKSVFFVGEVMPVRALNYWIGFLPDVQFTNLYGQSEIAGIACYYIVDGIHDEDSLLPIGKPLSNCRVFLFENSKIISDVNTVGEIMISSEALSIGYYHDVDNPSFEIIDGKRVFHTGDYAYYDTENNLVFTARRDSQIKHFGRRIELGEIEAAAGSMEGVARCCCLFDDNNGKIVLFCQTQATSEHIKEYLSNKLSKYMIPEKVVVMDELPINPNGKINRQLLRGFIDSRTIPGNPGRSDS